MEFAQACEERLYAAGEAVVREGAPGTSMFVVREGEAQVRITAGGASRVVATLQPGDFFGEMSLLTGERRTATVEAATDCHLMEITAASFRTFVLDRADVLERVGVAAHTRRAELGRVRDRAMADMAPFEPAQSFLTRVRHFLRLVD